MQQYESWKQCWMPNIKEHIPWLFTLHKNRQNEPTVLENGIIVNLGKKVGRPEGEQGGFQGYWSCDLGTNYTCNVSENSTYIFMNCTLCSMCIFFEDYKSHSFAGDCNVQFNIWTTIARGGSLKSKSHSGTRKILGLWWHCWGTKYTTLEPPSSGFREWG